MEQILMDSIHYLETTNNEGWKFFLKTATIEIMNPSLENRHQLKKGIITLYTPLLQDISKMKLIVFPTIKHYSTLDKNSIKPYFAYFEDEHKCLLSIEELLKTKSEKLDNNLPILSIFGILCHAVGESHVENTTRLTKEIELQNSINNGFCTNTFPEPIPPINHVLIKGIHESCNKIVKKSNQS